MTEQLEQIPLESYAAAYADIQARVKGDLWAMADICAAVESNYGESNVPRFLEELKKQGVQLSRSYFYALVKPSRYFPEKSTRADNLSFTHYRTAANMSETAHEAQEYIALASDQNWTTTQLGENISKMTGRAKENDRRKLLPNPKQIYTVEIEVDLGQWEDFQSAIALIESEYTELTAFLLVKILEKGRELSRVN